MPVFSELWAGGPRFAGGEPAFPPGTDAVLLADFVRTAGVRRAMDLGCGAGVLSVLLLARTPGLSMDGIDLLPEAAALCRENLEQNGWDGSGVVAGDLRETRRHFAAGAYDLVVCNPPYFPAGSGRTAADPARAGARQELTCTLREICAAAAYLCRNGGAFALVHRPERLAEVLCALSDAGLEPKRLRLAAHRAEAPPSLLLAEGRRNGKPGLSVEPQLILCKPDGSYSEEYRKICRLP